jgi:FAD/FMN-containing dehydrogenases
LGSSYGDSSFQKECTVDMTNLNKIIFYDKLKGEIHCHSGCSLKQILDLIIPDCWFIPVSPGTKYVTIGGMVASNVPHKKHHRVGSKKKKRLASRYY